VPARDTDAYGQLIWDHHCGRPSAEVIERDDGWFGVSTGAPAYFAPFARWPAHQRAAMRFVRGRVLDVGAGAGRVALHLQARGHAVVAIDASPLAIRTCRARGVRDARVLLLAKVSARLGVFDTIVMLGNNFGLFGSPARARRVLRRLRARSSPGARIVAETRNPYVGALPEHRRYHAWNRRRRRPAGQVRMRVRWGRACTAWFDYLFVSPSELRAILAGTGWRVARLLPPRGAMYVAILEKT
jgi:SAM-dependent methyltransferase